MLTKQSKAYLSKTTLAIWFVVLLAVAMAIVLGPVAPVFAFFAGLGVTALQASLMSFGVLSLGAMLISAIMSFLKPDPIRYPTRWAVMRAGQFGCALMPLAVLVFALTLPYSLPILVALSLSVPVALMLLQIIFSTCA